MQRPSRHTLALVCIVALIALAGCSGASQTQSGDGDTSDTDTSGELTSLDQQLVQQHRLALLDAGNYTAFLTTSEDGSSSTTIASVDLTQSSRYNQITTSSGIALEEYRPPDSDTLYQQFGSGSSATYYSKSAPNNFTASQITAPYLITDVNYTQFGTDTIDGTTVQRFVANDVSSLDITSSGWGGPLVTNISSTVLVDADQRLVYEIDATYTVQTGSGEKVESSYTLRYSNVGSTTVTEPDWLSQAK